MCLRAAEEYCSKRRIADLYLCRSARSRTHLELRGTIVITTNKSILAAVSLIALSNGSLGAMAEGTACDTGVSECVNVRRVDTSQCLPVRVSKPRLALALGGGGIRGAAHVGVLKVLEREGIPVDCISGCSMGAIIGGLYCAGVPVSVIEQKLLSNEISRAYLPFWVRNELLRPIPLLAATITRQTGMVSARHFASYIEKQAPGARIESMQKGFSAVCTDLTDGRPCSIKAGSLAAALATSSALPPFVKPIKEAEGTYIDGAITANLPVKSARDFGASLVIGVSVDDQMGKCNPGKINTMKRVGDRMAGIALSVIDHFHATSADGVITPDVSGIKLFSNKHSDVVRAIRAGEIAAEAALPQIRQLLQEKGVLNVNAYANPTSRQTIGATAIPQ